MSHPRSRAVGAVALAVLCVTSVPAAAQTTPVVDARPVPAIGRPLPKLQGFRIELPMNVPTSGTSFRLVATAMQDGERVEVPVIWTADEVARAWVSPDGVVTLIAPGKVTLRASYGLSKTETRLNVRKNTAAQVVMARKVIPAVRVGDTVQVRATVLDGRKKRLDDASVAYALVVRGGREGAAVVTEDGRFVASEPGIYTVLAESNRITAWSAIVVEAPATAAAGTDLAMSKVTKLSIEHAGGAPYVGTTTSLVAEVRLGGWRGVDSSAAARWSSSAPAVAYVNQAGQVVFVGKGRAEISASYDGRVAKHRFDVVEHPASRLALRPGSVDVQVGRPVKFREDVWGMGGYPVRDARVNYAVIAHGESDVAVPATISEQRVFTATRPGVYTVIAEVGGVSDKFTLLVRPAYDGK